MKQYLFFLLLLISLNSFSQEKFEVFFDFNQDVPNEVSIQKLNLWIAENKMAEITKLLGFCDDVDTKNYNKKLAERRIKNVFQILQNNNININPNLETLAFGKDFKQSKIQAENRKVTVFYSKQKLLDNTNPNINSEFTEKIKNAKVGELIKLPNIYFFNNSARIIPKSQPSLYDLFCAMEENPKLKIEIQGHICCQLVFDLNNISIARARAIYTFLIRNKIDKKRMTFKGYGTSRPVYKIPEKNSQEEDENRRVEILILEN